MPKYRVLLRRSIIQDVEVFVEASGRIKASKKAIASAESEQLNWMTSGTIDTHPYSVSEDKVIENIHKKLPYFIMMVGIPGSGKSLWVEKLYNLLLGRGFTKLQIVNPDLIREELTGSVSQQTVNKDVWVKAEKWAHDFLGMGYHVILDATNTKEHQWRDFMSKLPPCKILVKCIEVDPVTAYERIQKDLKKRKNRCDVPEEAVYRYYGQYLHTKRVLEGQKHMPVTFLDSDESWEKDLKKTRELLMENNCG